MNHNIVDAVPMPEPSPKRLPNSATPINPVRPGASTPAVWVRPDVWTHEHVMKPMAFMPAGVKKLPRLFRQDDPNRMVPEAVVLMRQHLLQEIGPLPTSALNRFVRTLLADDELVESYFTYKVREDALGRTFAQRGRLLTATPWVEAKRAAVLAARADTVRHFRHEQALVWVAAWAFPSGLFHLCHPHMKHIGVELTSLVQARNETTVMVEDAVSAMRREDRPAGDALGAILGLGYDDDTDPDQLARLGTALHLSQRHINNMWIPASGWGYQA